MAYFTTGKTFLLPSFEPLEKEREVLDEFLQLLEDSGIGRIIEENCSKNGETRGRKRVNPYRMFAAVLYGFSVHSGSLRKLEESMGNDLRFIYLMEQERPSYAAISLFLNNIIVKSFSEIYGLVMRQIVSKLEIDTSDAYIDGTKLEANANKYKFVWRPATFRKKLNENAGRLASELLGCQTGSITSMTIANWVTSLSALAKEEASDRKLARNGKPIRGPYEKGLAKMSAYLEKSLEYDEKDRLCGEGRNSYYKTDVDATAMALKEDYYSGVGSNMHAAYNAQIIVSKGFPLAYMVTQDRADFGSLAPLLESYMGSWGHYPKNLCADAGYGSLANYRFLKSKGIGNYVKYGYFRKDVEGTSVRLYGFEGGKLTCLNGKTGEPASVTRHPKREGARFYAVKCPRACRFKEICRRPLKSKKGNERVFEASEELESYKDEALSNLLSPKGIEMRVNRSTQVEGTFGVIKQDMGYERFRRRGLEMVTFEFGMVCLGLAVRRFLRLISGKGSMAYWVAPENLEAQEMAEPNIEKILKKKAKKRFSDPRKK